MPSQYFSIFPPPQNTETENHCKEIWKCEFSAPHHRSSFSFQESFPFLKLR